MDRLLHLPAPGERRLQVGLFRIGCRSFVFPGQVGLLQVGWSGWARLLHEVAVQVGLSQVGCRSVLQVVSPGQVVSFGQVVSREGSLVPPWSSQGLSSPSPGQGASLEVARSPGVWKFAIQALALSQYRFGRNDLDHGNDFDHGHVVADDGCVCDGRGDANDDQER